MRRALRVQALSISFTFPFPCAQRSLISVRGHGINARVAITSVRAHLIRERKGTHGGERSSFSGHGRPQEKRKGRQKAGQCPENTTVYTSTSLIFLYISCGPEYVTENVMTVRSHEM